MLCRGCPVKVGQQVIVENRLGAGGNIGMGAVVSFVAKEPPQPGRR
jgi:tripartite-type tricarboxylate transporter receptor subunit TctC